MVRTFLAELATETSTDIPVKDDLLKATACPDKREMMIKVNVFILLPLKPLITNVANGMSDR